MVLTGQFFVVGSPGLKLCNLNFSKGQGVQNSIRKMIMCQIDSHMTLQLLIFIMCPLIGQFLKFFNFHPMQIKIGIEGNHSVLLTNFRSKMRLMYV